MALTERQRKFVHAYATNGQNGTAAAREAGYAGDENSLAVTASRMLRLAKIQEAIGALTQKAVALAERRMGRKVATLAECLEFLTLVKDTHIAAPLNDDGSVSIEKLRAMPAGVVRKLKVKSTTDENGQVYAQHEIDMESAVQATHVLVKHYEHTREHEQRERLLSDAIGALPAASVAQLARFMLTGPKPIDVEARVLTS